MRLPKRPEQWIMLMVVGALLIFVSRHTARNGIGDTIEVDTNLHAVPELPFPASVTPVSENTSFIALGDVARCRPKNLVGYVKLGLNYVSNDHIASYGVSEGAEKTSRLAAKFADAEILGLGDLVYPHGSLFSYKNCFDKYFGSMRKRFHPVPGNHDYKRSRAAGYFAYWGERAGPRGKGYYSFDRGNWHIIALNSELYEADFTEQVKWLQSDLSRTSARCILAFFHRPAFSARDPSGDWGSRKLFSILYNYGASLILSGHNHFYERTAPVDPRGNIAPGRGIRTFVVGTGGTKMVYGAQAASFTEALISKAWGILKLDLGPNGYGWQFLSAPGGEAKDSGTDDCVKRNLLLPITVQNSAELPL